MPETTAQRAPLEDLMVAMDVVDTLRHRDELVGRELSSEARRADMIERLRAIYTAQGIEVTDAALKQGVEALEQERFAFQPTPPSLQRRLALIYIRRDVWLKPLSFVVGLALVIWIGWLTLVAWPAASERADLPDQIAERVTLIESSTDDDVALGRAREVARSGQLALSSGDVGEGKEALTELDSLILRLQQRYEIRVVSRPNELSGVWRVPEANPSGRNFYLIVEAVDDSNERVAVPIVSEEDNQQRQVTSWGIRVSEAAFNAVAADKRDDGIIQTNIVGRKRVGELEPDYLIDTPGGAITRW